MITLFVIVRHLSSRPVSVTYFHKLVSVSEQSL